MQDIDPILSTLVRNNGSIVGLNRLKRKGRKKGPGDQFKLRIRNAECNEPGLYQFTTISIDRHGFDKGFEIAVEKIVEWLALSTEQQHQLIQCKKYYETPEDIKARFETCLRKKAETDRPYAELDGEERAQSNVRIRKKHVKIPDDWKFSNTLFSSRDALRFFTPRQPVSTEEDLD